MDLYAYKHVHYKNNIICAKTLLNKQDTLWLHCLYVYYR